MYACRERQWDFLMLLALQLLSMIHKRISISLQEHILLRLPIVHFICEEALPSYKIFKIFINIRIYSSSSTILFKCCWNTQGISASEMLYDSCTLSHHNLWPHEIYIISHSLFSAIPSSLPFSGCESLLRLRFWYFLPVLESSANSEPHLVPTEASSKTFTDVTGKLISSEREIWVRTKILLCCEHCK